jgi:cyclohexa-1,5-dienecarbonyl-CoA hydratase
MVSNRVQITFDVPFARLALAHGKQNVIDVQMMDELSQAIADVEHRPEVSTIILSGAGEHFSAGVDIPAHSPDKVAVMLDKFHNAIRRLVRTTKVTLAIVRGYCFGGGAELAMVCDMVVTTDSAHWGFPEIKLGCYPPVAAATLAAVIGQKRAAELVLTGRLFDGREAAQLGLANRVAVPGKQFDEAVLQYEQCLSGLSPTALVHAKRALYSWDAAHFEKGLARAESIYLKDLIHTHDAQEGIRAWMEKRKPIWTGK